MLKKGTIQQVNPTEGQCLSNLFLVPKKDGEHRPVIKLKYISLFPSSLEGSTISKRFFMQTGSEVCLRLQAILRFLLEYLDFPAPTPL